MKQFHVKSNSEISSKRRKAEGIALGFALGLVLTAMVILWF